MIRNLINVPCRCLAALCLLALGALMPVGGLILGIFLLSINPPTAKWNQGGLPSDSRL